MVNYVECRARPQRALMYFSQELEVNGTTKTQKSDSKKTREQMKRKETESNIVNFSKQFGYVKGRRERQKYKVDEE